MSKTTEKAGLFVKEVLARLTGDDVSAVAAKIARKSISALEGQVAALNGKVVDDENKVEDAQDALNMAIYPTAVPTDSGQYCRNIIRAQENLDKAKEDLEATKASIAFFKGILEQA